MLLIIKYPIIKDNSKGSKYIQIIKKKKNDWIQLLHHMTQSYDDCIIFNLS
jgi:hypothetical protein